MSTLLEKFEPTTAPHRAVSGDLLELFLTVREVQNCEPVTLRNYRSAVGRFLTLRALPGDTRAWTGDHLVLHLASLRRAGLAPSTQAWHQRHLYAFFGWLLEHGDLSADIRRAVPRIRVPQVRGRAVTPELGNRLAKLAGDRFRTRQGNLTNPEHLLRNVALVRVLQATAARREELAHVQLGDVDFSARTILLRKTKGKRERVVPFDAETHLALQEYRLRERGDAPGPLFLQRGGVAMTSNAIRLVLQRLGKRAGTKVSSHDFRRGTAAEMRRNGMDLGHVAEILGHATLAMSIVYSQTGEEAAAISAYRRTMG